MNSGAYARICYVLDIETRPDKFARTLAGKKVLKATSPLHEIINISTLRLEFDIDDRVIGVRLATWNEARYREPDILANASEAIREAISSGGEVVTYNGKRFDLPLMRLRQMRWWQCSHEALRRASTRAGPHFDVMEALAGGLSQMPSLAEACAMIGFSLKGPARATNDYEVAHEIEKCETDVVGTAILYLYCLADRNGRPDLLGVNLTAVGSYLRTVAGNRQHLLRFAKSPLLGERACPWGVLDTTSADLFPRP